MPGFWNQHLNIKRLANVSEINYRVIKLQTIELVYIICISNNNLQVTGRTVVLLDSKMAPVV